MLPIRRRQTTVPQVVTLIAGNKQRSLLIVGDDDELFMTRSLNITPKTTEQHLTARNDKSVAYVTNNKRLRSTFCTTGATTTLQTKLRHFYVITKYSSAYKPWTAGRELRP